MANCFDNKLIWGLFCDSYIPRIIILWISSMTKCLATKDKNKTAAGELDASRRVLFFIIYYFFTALKVSILQFWNTFLAYVSIYPALHPGFSNPLALSSTLTTLLLLSMSYLYLS